MNTSDSYANNIWLMLITDMYISNEVFHIRVSDYRSAGSEPLSLGLATDNCNSYLEDTLRWVWNSHGKIL